MAGGCGLTVDDWVGLLARHVVASHDDVKAPEAVKTHNTVDDLIKPPPGGCRADASGNVGPLQGSIHHLQDAGASLGNLGHYLDVDLSLLVLQIATRHNQDATSIAETTTLHIRGEASSLKTATGLTWSASTRASLSSSDAGTDLAPKFEAGQPPLLLKCHFILLQER